MAERIELIIVDLLTEEVEDNKPYMKIVDLAGQTWKIKQGKNGALKAKWGMLQPKVALKLNIGKFNGFDYIEDFDTVLNIYAVQAIQALQEFKKSTKEESIEAQTAVKIISEQEIAGVAEKWQIDLLDNYLKSALKRYKNE